MSYDNSKSMPSSSNRGRLAGANGKDPEADSQGLNVHEICSSGQLGASVTHKDQESGGGGGSSPSDGSQSGGSSRDQRCPTSDDMDGISSGNDSGERESEGGMERESRSRGHQSARSSHSSSNGKDSGMILETTESNKSSNSQSLSPPSGSLVYSLPSSSSEHHPLSTSGCSSNQSARVQTQKELMKAIKELKLRLPAERKAKGHFSTLNALKYALQCVKQVRANKEYYHQWSVEECHGCSLDLSTFTIEELDNITSEYTLKNTDTFSMAVSFLSGKVVYISPQGSSVLRCKPECLQGTIFSDLLAPQDVSTFYSSTAPCRLPQWASCIGSASPPVDCTQEKSMFCRLSADRPQGGEMRYYPFRLTPYQLTIRDSDAAEPQPCCLLIAERVHSGYEAPRIPPDKRIFTTSHTPSCLFQEVDERAVPLLGYLPQDLVGTPILLCIHPEDRHIMVAIHEKIFQFAGQPVDYSPLRMCARSGEYVTMDTSWSSFVNPWSRKVAFIVGRHKVRTSPLNEDVFTAPQDCENRVTTPDIVHLSEQIHRLLVQPVHSSSSQGYSSLGSSGSRGSHRSNQQHLSASAASSSDSNSPVVDEAAGAFHKPMTFQQICKDVHMVKTNGQQVFIESRNRPLPRKNTSTVTAAVRAINSDPVRSLIADMTNPSKSLVPAPLVPKEPSTSYSYQQINCLDSVIRYLDSCNIPNTVKRKCGSYSCTASSASDDDKQEPNGNSKGGSVNLVGEPPPLPPLTMATKAESVASVTSQCSFSSTIVHVGDKKPPESDIVMEETPTTPTPAAQTPLDTTPTPPASSLELPANIAPPPPPPPPPPPLPQASQPDRDSRRSGSVGAGAAGGGGSRLGLTKEVLSAHTQQEEQAFLDRFKDLSKLRVVDQTVSSTVRCHAAAVNPLSRGVRCSRDYPAAGGSSGHRRGRGGKRLKHQESSDQHSSLGLSGGRQDLRSSTAPMPLNMPLGPPTTSSSWPSVGSQASMPPAAFPPGMLPIYPIYPPLTQPLPVPDPSRFPPTQMVPPMMAFVLPNYMFPQMGVPMCQPGSTPGPFYNPNFGYQGVPTAAVPTAAVPTAAVPITVSNPMPTPGTCALSRSSTPQSYTQTPADREGAESPLFQSRCSSPLNLLQLEESPSNRLEVATALAASQQASPSVQGGAARGQSSTNQRSSDDTSKENENGEANESNNDAMSTSSDLLDLLLQEDSRSGTGSAASGSGSSGTRSSGSGSGSNGCSSSGTSGTISSQGSHTSKYFGSIDSSENDHSRKQPAGGSSSAGGDGGEEQFIKCVLQDPIWLLMANTDDKVMMTYQLPVRDLETVLREDRESLRNMQKHQPRFTEEQKRELSQVHPWIRTGRLPRAINISGCTGCKSPPAVPPAAPFDVEIHDMELCSVLKAEEESAGEVMKSLTEAAHHEDEEEEEGVEDKGTEKQDSSQDMVAEEEGARSDTVEGKSET
ncbi:period circadian protein homolog 1b [Astatotilapia calliptera]|uniref:PAS domain-containing protein n=1 Tax=Astatotilapia calliptera TaxID=8154 RepID=A0A3P8NZJ6_ASTCA|nr:period circadian protein homolog 1 [Astatotilapia calliptera]XP_026017877.1 period circadian protein homolog 1 [Astatotilapia calliptera]